MTNKLKKIFEILCKTFSHYEQTFYLIFLFRAVSRSLSLSLSFYRSPPFPSLSYFTVILFSILFLEQCRESPGAFVKASFPSFSCSHYSPIFTRFAQPPIKTSGYLTQSAFFNRLSLGTYPAALSSELKEKKVYSETGKLLSNAVRNVRKR